MNISTDEEDLLIIFNKACTYFASISAEKESEDLLQFYSLYKQAIVGPCNILRPGFFDFKGKQKWDSWNSLGTMSKQQAMERYINKLTNICSCWKEEEAQMKSGWISVSRMLPEKDINEADKTLFHFVQENNLEKIRAFSTDSLHSLDSNNMTALHWACDRGYFEMSQFLISKDLNVNIKDIDGQTPLHYASSCGHISVVKLLLDNGAKIDIADSDGCLPFDVAENKETKELLRIFTI